MRKFLVMIIILASAAAGVYLGYLKSHQDNPRPTGPVVSVMFLDAERGGGVLIKTPEGSWTIIDPGPADLAPNVINYLQWLQVKSLDVIVTNPNADRVGAASALMQALPVGRFIHGGRQSRSRAWLNTIRDVESRNIPEQIAHAGQAIRLSPTAKLVVLSPPADLVPGVYRDSDDNSLVLQLRFGQKRFLFTSDIRTAAEAHLIRLESALESDVLLLARSGKVDSTCLEFLSCVRPAYCIISCGGKSGAPSPSVLQRVDRKNSGADLYRTDKDGTIEMISDGKRMSVDIRVGDG